MRAPSSRSNHLPKALFPKTITWGIRTSPMNFRGTWHEHSAYGRARHGSWPCAHTQDGWDFRRQPGEPLTSRAGLSLLLKVFSWWNQAHSDSFPFWLTQNYLSYLHVQNSFTFGHILRVRGKGQILLILGGKGLWKVSTAKGRCYELTLGSMFFSCVKEVFWVLYHAYFESCSVFNIPEFIMFCFTLFYHVRDYMHFEV